MIGLVDGLALGVLFPSWSVRMFFMATKDETFGTAFDTARGKNNKIGKTDIDISSDWHEKTLFSLE